MWDRRRDDSIYPKLMTVSVVRGRTGEIEYFLANFVDISSYKDAEQRIDHIARHDALTGLPNRLHLQTYLEQSLLIARRMSEQVCVMFLDLDRFKNVNDTLGHGAGDILLIQTAKRLKSSVREYDMVARLGGDEFVVVLRGHEMVAVASKVAETIRQQLNSPFHIDKHVLRTATSIGISLFPDDSLTMADMMKQADTAMYFAKSVGGNGFRFFAPDMDAHAHDKLELENLLYDAIELQQFELYYQPQLSIPDQTLVGAEVLLRWIHPDKGFISPAVFIPLAETTNQIGRIGEWVLENACLQASEWLRQGLPVGRIGVNISARQFLHSNLYELVQRVLLSTGLPAENLELELTETAVTTSPQEAASLLQALRKEGIKIALDDFGQGYSSLAQLKDMPLDRLKIDAAFVWDINDRQGEKGGVIAAATIGLGHALGFQVIAEGVETEAQLAFLVAHACDEVQGYYFAKPMPRQAFEEYLRKHMKAV
ncbi:MAG: EAL domain-containing protein [Rhodoferax sp.]|uniref:putative bifunctional diguanylate cyclase/phosphodiesterase n=1 Tax=Rhodoferax sp. TaxID=50421 RepID=UPI00261BB9FB|nr:EAL domain-containing protein [Rhodoferax sp.]MDD2882337.1 EAL domain-containing protein [Rhodoferax sp.]